MSNPFTGQWQQTGTGAPVLCLSGFASSNWMLRAVLEPLCQHGTFILPDNRGMGRSPPAQAAYQLDDLANDALQLMDDLGHKRFTVIGLSMGGFIAQLLALAAPQRVTGLVLLCTSSAGPLFKPLMPLMSRQQVADIYHLPPQERIRAALDPSICPLLSHRYPQVYEEIFQQRLAHPENIQQIMRQYDAVADFLNRCLDLTVLNCPTLVLAGEQDRLVPLANSQLLAQQIPQAQLTVIPDTDHLFFLEQRAVVGQHIVDFLEKKSN